MSNTGSRNNRPLPRLALTPGEPAGIGPDLAIKLALAPPAAAIVCIADPEVLRRRARELGADIDVRVLADVAHCPPAASGVLQVYAVHAAVPVSPGQLDPRNAAYVLDCLRTALEFCSAGTLDALVTGPVQKSLINDAGIAFSGHTEFLAERLGCGLPVMMLVNDNLRVALVTTHVPLREVCDLITAERVSAVVEVVHDQLRHLFGIANPRIGVCGLNPHAGEGGHLGGEDDSQIRPAVAALRERGWLVDGPVPADTAFTHEQRAHYDAIVAMYHDQGLTALKALGFGDAVNVTLGLPIIRTSVDHGTALTRAATGNIDSGSLHASVKLACELVAARGRHGAL